MTVGDDGPQSEYDLASRMETTLRRSVPLTRTDSPPVQPTSKTSDIDRIMGVLSTIAGASLQDIDRMIDHLSTLRERLKVDGDRIQHDIADYIHLSRIALESTQVIADRLAQLKSISNEQRAG